MKDIKTAVAIGTFDGLHTGHISVLSAVLGIENMKHAVATFNEPPRRKSKNIEVPMLMSSERKNRLLSEMGFDEIINLDYDKIHDQSPQEFLDNLFERYNVGAISCGFNYRFGKDGVGDAAFISEYCRSHGVESIVCPSVAFAGTTVSSTNIRNLIKNGDIAFANTLMKEPFTYSGEIIHGDSRGHTIGFPTINVPLDKELVIPKFGVYASIVTLGGKKYNAVTNIGIRPTFLLEHPLSETYLMDFSGDVYGDTAEISLMSFIRDEQKFNNIDELKAAIESDKQNALKRL